MSKGTRGPYIEISQDSGSDSNEDGMFNDVGSKNIYIGKNFNYKRFLFETFTFHIFLENTRFMNSKSMADLISNDQWKKKVYFLYKGIYF